jgi:hypothetical protein
MAYSRLSAGGPHRSVVTANVRQPIGCAAWPVHTPVRHARLSPKKTVAGRRLQTRWPSLPVLASASRSVADQDLLEPCRRLISRARKSSAISDPRIVQGGQDDRSRSFQTTGVARFEAPLLTHLKVTLRPGNAVTLVNLATNGALAHSRRPLRPGTPHSHPNPGRPPHRSHCRADAGMRCRRPQRGRRAVRRRAEVRHPVRAGLSRPADAGCASRQSSRRPRCCCTKA